MDERAVRNRLFYTLFVSQSLFSAAQIAVFTLVAIVAVRLSGTESVAGTPTTTQTFSQALAAFPAALVMGRFGRRLGLSAGFAVGALGGVVGVVAITQGIFPLLLVSMAMLGMSRASGEQSRFAVGEMFPEAERARMIGRLVFAGTVGAVAGPVLVAPSGRLMASWGLDPDIGPWVVMATLCAVGAVLIFTLLRPDPMMLARSRDGNVAAAARKEAIQSARPLGALLALPKVQLSVIAVLISQTVMVILMVMTPLHMDHLHHGRDAISMVIAAHTLGMFGLSPLTGGLIDRFGRVPMLLVGALTLAAAALLAPAAGNEWVLAVALFLLGLGWNFGYVSGSSLLAYALQGAEQTRVQGVNDALVSFGAGLASLAAGPLFASGGYSAVSIAAMVVIVPLIALVARFREPGLEPAKQS